MARTGLAVTRLTEAGIDPGDVDAAANLADGNSFGWAANRLLYVMNGDATELTVTVVTAVTVGRSGLAVADITITVPPGEYRLAGPFGLEAVQPGTGLVHVDYAGAAAAVSAAVLDAARA